MNSAKNKQRNKNEKKSTHTHPNKTKQKTNKKQTNKPILGIDKDYSMLHLLQCMCGSKSSPISDYLTLRISAVAFDRERYCLR